MTLTMIQRASLLLMDVCGTQRPDWKTSRADARTALCLAHGVPAEFIDALGYDITDKSYASVRASWVRHIGMHGWHDQFDLPQLDIAHGYWLASRPDLASGDDWLADGWPAHLARYAAGPCSTTRTCDICHPSALLDPAEGRTDLL